MANRVNLMRSAWLVAAALSAMGMGLAPAAAQQVPLRPITLVVPFAPGGGIDSQGRIVASSLEATGQRVVVENRPGAGGYTGSEYVARAAPDGQTLLMNALTSLHSSLFVRGAADLSSALVPVAQVSESDSFLMASTTIPPRNLRDFVAYAKKNPKKLNAAVLLFNRDHLSTLRFLQVAGIDVVPVPYNSSADAIRALIAGDVHLYLVGISVMQPHVDAGKVVVLADTAPKRSAVLPEVPTVAEQGINFEVRGQTFVVLAPSKTDPELVRQLNKRISAALNNPKARESLRKMGYLFTIATPEELAAQVAKEVRDMRQAAADFNMTPQ